MQNGGQRDRQSGDVGQCVEVCRAGAVAHPQPFLSRRLKAGIVTLTLCTQGVCSLETEAAAVNGKSVVCWNGLILGAAPVLLPVIPVFVAARANTGFGLAEWAAEFLPGTMIVGGFAVLVHSQPGRADWITDRNRFRGFRAAWIEGDKSLALIDRFHGVVDDFRIVALIREKGTSLQRENLVGCGEDVNGNCGIHDVGLGGQLVERQAGDAVHQHMALVPPVERIPPLIVLVGGRMDAQSAVRVAFGRFSLENLLFAKDFGLFCFVFAMTGVESGPTKDASTTPSSYSFRTRLAMIDFNAPLFSCRRQRSYVQ